MDLDDEDIPELMTMGLTGYQSSLDHCRPLMGSLGVSVFSICSVHGARDAAI